MADGLNSAPDDRFCDLVMKGGITSGVVYPRAIAKLAEVYRFRSIGGTSAGAIAAVCTAAAEYRRRGHKEGAIEAGDMTGFIGLRNMANELSVKGKLFSLFQPGKGRRRLFTVVEAALNARNKWTRTGKILWGLMVGYFAGTVLSAVIAWLTYMATASIVAAILMFIVLWLALTLLGVLFNVTGPVVDANYGLCSGMPAQATLRKRLWRRLTGQPDPQALMPWLHQKVQEFAGLPLDKPLTFGMLWNAEGRPPEWSGIPKDGRSIELQMFTTSLSHGRPYILPLDGETQQLYYLREDLAEVAPDEVIAWLDAKFDELKDYVPPAGGPDGLRPLPEAADFPVVLAARMSLSFPLLFTAIPLYVLEEKVWPADGQRQTGTVRRCLFSDGGIASNFPIHLFDGMLPKWPTFAMQLETLPPEVKPETRDEQLVRLPASYDEGFEERWDRFDDESKGGASRFGGFLFAIIGTMQNWNDNALARIPGVRDRVVRVGMFENEGGLNLNMLPETIERITQRGSCAVATLLDRYAPPSSGAGAAPGWDEQRWVRLGVLLTMMRKRFGSIKHALGNLNPHATAYDMLIERSKAPPLMAGLKQPLTDVQAKELAELLKALENQAGYASLVSDDPADPFRAHPEPDLRIRPSL